MRDRGEDLPVNYSAVDFGGGEMGIVDTCWFVGAGFFVGEFGENPLVDISTRHFKG